MHSGIKIEIIKQLTDNYSYVIYKKNTKNAIVIDPAEAKPIIKFIKKNNLSLKGILITHHHSDHTSGINDILKEKTIDVYSSNNKIFGTTKLLKDKDIIDFDFINFNIMASPGHTFDHIVFFNKKENLLFCGDVLFYYGCGRVFEGTMKQMLDTLNKIYLLPDDTKVFCGHEYTYKNLEFVFNELVAFPNSDIVKKKCRERIKKNGSSMPFYLGHQKARNPFFNCNNIFYKEDIANFHKNKGKISSKANELEFFTFIRNKRNTF